MTDPKISQSGYQRIRRAANTVAAIGALWYAIPSPARRWIVGTIAGLLSLGWLTAGGSPDAPKHGAQHWLWIVDLVLNIEWKVRALVFCGVVFALAVVYAVHVVRAEAKKTRDEFHAALREGLGPVAKLYELVVARQDESDIQRMALSGRIERLEREVLPATAALPDVTGLRRRRPQAHTDSFPANDDVRYAETAKHAMP